MGNDIIVVVGFIIVLIIMCKIWNLYMMRQYDKSKTEIRKKVMIKYGSYIDDMDKLVVAGTGNDRNNDYEFIKAVRKIDMSDETKVKIYD